MGNFPSLLYNELVKIWARWANRVLVILLALVAVTISGLSWFSLRGAEANAESDSTEQLQTQMETLQEEQPEDYEEQLQILEFLLANNIEVDRNNWRLMAVQRLSDDIHTRNALLESRSEADREKAAALTLSIERDRELIVTQDYRGYYEKKTLRYPEGRESDGAAAGAAALAIPIRTGLPGGCKGQRVEI